MKELAEYLQFTNVVNGFMVTGETITSTGPDACIQECLTAGLIEWDIQKLDTSGTLTPTNHAWSTVFWNKASTYERLRAGYTGHNHPCEQFS